MMNANIPLFSLKFKSYGWKGNEFQYVFLVISVLLLLVFRLVGVPLIIISYVLISIAQNRWVADKKKPGNE